MLDAGGSYEKYLRICIWSGGNCTRSAFVIQIAAALKAYFNFPPFVERLPNHISQTSTTSSSALKLGKCIYIFSQEAEGEKSDTTQLGDTF